MVFCFDSYDSWRKKDFPYYKANRKKSREVSDIDWDKFFKNLNQIKQDLKEFFPYYVIEVPHCEGDDVIAVLTEHIKTKKDSTQMVPKVDNILYSYITNLTQKMIKLTLDTNCIINLLDYKSESATSVEELSEILRYGLDGDVNIAITTRVERDFEKDKDNDRKNELAKRLSMFPTVGSVVRTDVSKLDSEDVSAGDEHEALEKELTGILFPGLKADDAHYSNKINDIDHLIGHKINKRDIFVTDDQQILKKAETLKSSLRIQVMSPKETLEYLNLKGNKAVLTQEFYDKFLEYKDIVIDIISTGHTTEEQLTKYEELRKWLVRKYPVLQDHLINFKFRSVSIPTGGNRLFGADDYMSIQMFNDRLNGILKERTPSLIPEIASTHRHDYGMHYKSPREQIEMTINFLNSVEDLLLGYLGKVES
jgi:hypothetical protein